MDELKGFQKKYLRGLAHAQKPVVIVGQKGMTDALVASADEALETHELIKIKFNEFKEKEQKIEISEDVAKRTKSELVGMIGHISIFYRMQKDPKKRTIKVPATKKQMP